MKDQLDRNNPLVSVVIPVYNGEKFIADSIQSVLGQTYQPVEIIVVDDGSGDSTAEIARSFEGVKYIYQENQGHGQAKNTGIDAANGDYLAFNDVDDVWKPKKLELQMDILQKNPEIGYAICEVRNFLEPGTPMPEYMKSSDFEKEYPGYIPSALVIRRQILEQAGNFNPGFKRSNDSDWFFRAKDAGIRMFIVDEALVRRRIHLTNLSHDRGIESQPVKEMFQLLRNSVHRKTNEDFE
jgi:glycosyltransferase involved in cell wall biosynthesis